MAHNAGEPRIEKRRTANTILLVEGDLDAVAFLLRAISQETCYLTLLAGTGIEALEVVKEIKPNLLILDYHFPYMNGLELYNLLCATRGLGDRPGIILTADLDRHADEIEQRHLAGLAKPIDLNDLLTTIEWALA